MSYITTRQGTDNLQFRMTVPGHLQKIVGRREVIFSLKTKNRREAERRARPITEAYKRRWRELEAEHGLERQWTFEGPIV